MTDFQIHGHCDQRFLSVRDAFIRNFEDGQELGASFALSVGGDMVVDLWGGFDGPKRTAPWKEDTIVQVSSSSKVVVSLCGLLLIDRGLIALDEPVATWWPEFAQNGKSRLPVRYIFSHSTGIPGIHTMPGWDVVSNPQELARLVAAEKPWWEPGTKSGYQGFTYGTMIDELVRRTAGKDIARFFQDEVGRPLDIDFAFGLPPERAARRATIEIAPVEEEFDPAIKESIYYLAFGYQQLSPDFAKRLESGEVLSRHMPAGNGVTNARALARIGSLLATGKTSEGERFITEETAALPYEEQIYKRDMVFWEPVRYGIGFGISSKEISFPWPNTFHWGGAGGSSVFMVPELGAAWSYTPSRFYTGRGSMDHRGQALRKVTIECLQAIEGQR